MKAKRGEGKRREASRAYYEANAERLRAESRARYHGPEHEAILAQSADYRAAHGPQIAEAGRRYRAENRERINERQQAYRAANPDKVRASKKRWHAANRERNAARKKAWVEANRDRVRDGYLQRVHGITLATFNALLAEQGGRCAVCLKEPAAGHPLRVDHDHATGRVRGLLCDSCNLALGKLGDTVEALERAVEYLVEARRRAAAWAA